MTFIKKDEFLLYMDIPNINQELASEDDLKAIRDAGIQTTTMFYLFWGQIEKERGVYDWSSIDQYVERAERCGLKSMLMCYTSPPDWLPEEWYAKTRSGTNMQDPLLVHPKPDRGLLSPWNKDAMEYSLNIVRLMQSRYNRPGKSLVINSWHCHGETVMLNEPAWYDDCAQADYKARYGADTWPMPGTVPAEEWLRDSYLHLLTEQAKVFMDNEDKDIWTMLHPAIANFPGLYGNGCQWIPEYLQAYKELGAHINWVLYTYTQWKYLHPSIKSLCQLLDVDLFGGAEYADGLLQTTPEAITNGLRGQYVGPLHPYTQKLHIEPWMTENMRWATEQWKASR